MSSIIQLLPDHVANQMLLEVVQTSFSCQELLENAVDAEQRILN
jgi:UV DNA damage repair endonuclease